MAKAAELAKKSKSSLSSAQKSARSRLGTDTGPISIHTSELDFDFAAKESSKKKTKGTSDWNERWEQYRARRDQAQVKTVPAEEGSAQMEFENIFGKTTGTVAGQPAAEKSEKPVEAPQAAPAPAPVVEEYKPEGVQLDYEVQTESAEKTPVPYLNVPAASASARQLQQGAPVLRVPESPAAPDFSEAFTKDEQA